MSNPMKYTRLISLTLLMLAAAMPAGAEGVITLKSGESLPGTPLSIQDSYLNVNSAILAKPIELDMNEIERLETNAPIVIPDNYSEVKLSNGDILYGTLKELTDKQLKLETPWGGIITLNRLYVNHIGFNSSKLYHRDMTGTLEGWAPPTNSRMRTPELRDGGWLLRGGNNTELLKEMDQPARLHIQYTVKRTATFRILLSLWANKSNSNLINLSLTNSSAQLSKRINGRFQNLGNTGRNDSSQLIQGDKFTVDYFADNEHGNFYLFIDGKQIGKWENAYAIAGDMDENPDEPDQPKDGFEPGNIFRINCYSSKDMSISNMNIFSWNGSQPVMTTEPDGKHQENLPKDKVLLNNGDVLRGAISLADDGTIHVQSKNYDVYVPTNRIRSLNQVDVAKASEAPAIVADTRLHLNDRSTFSVTLKSIADGNVTLNSPVTGDVTVPLDKIKRFIFNITPAPEG